MEEKEIRQERRHCPEAYLLFKMYGKNPEYMETTVSCECGKYTGKKYKGLICEQCHTPLTPVIIHWI